MVCWTFYTEKCGKRPYNSEGYRKKYSVRMYRFSMKKKIVIYWIEVSKCYSQWTLLFIYQINILFFSFFPPSSPFPLPPSPFPLLKTKTKQPSPQRQAFPHKILSFCHWQILGGRLGQEHFNTHFFYILKLCTTNLSIQVNS